MTAAIIGVGGSLVSGALGSSAAKDAAGMQVAGSDRAAALQAQSSKDALDFAKKSYAQQQSNMAPWLAYGRGAVKTLGDLMGIKPDTAGQVNADGTPVAAPGASGAPDTSAADAVRNAYNGQPNLGGLYNHAGDPAPAGPTRGGGDGGDGTNSALNVGGGRGPRVLDGDPVAPPPATPSGNPQQSADVTRIAWPDGTKNEVPSHLVQEYESLGATRV